MNERANRLTVDEMRAGRARRRRGCRPRPSQATIRRRPLDQPGRAARRRHAQGRSTEVADGTEASRRSLDRPAVRLSPLRHRQADQGSFERRAEQVDEADPKAFLRAAARPADRVSPGASAGSDLRTCRLMSTAAVARRAGRPQPIRHPVEARIDVRPEASPASPRTDAAPFGRTEGRRAGGVVLHPRQRPRRGGHPRPPRAGRHPHGLVPQRLGRRSARPVRHRPFPRAPDVQGHRAASGRRVQPRSSRRSAARRTPSPPSTTPPISSASPASISAP